MAGSLTNARISDNNKTQVPTSFRPSIPNQLMTGLSSSSTFPPCPRDFTRDFARLKSWVPCLFQTMAQCDCDLIKLYFYCHLGSVVVLGNYMVLSICERVNTTYTLNLMLQLLCQDQRGCCAFTDPLVHLCLAGFSFLKRAELVKWPPSLTVGLSKLSGFSTEARALRTSVS